MVLILIVIVAVLVFVVDVVIICITMISQHESGDTMSVTPPTRRAVLEMGSGKCWCGALRQT